MPGSCESEVSSSPSGISSLRSFRFQNRTKRYQTEKNTDCPASSNNSVSQTPDSSAQKSISTPNRPIASTSCATYNPLSYRKYDATSSTSSIIQCIIPKIDKVIKNNNLNCLLLELKLTTDEIKKLKEVVLQRSSVSEKWASNVTEDHSIVSSCEKILKINHHYLRDLADYLNEVAASNLAKSSGHFLNNPPARNYSREQKTGSNSDHTSVSQKNCTDSPVENSNYNQRAESPKPDIMDDYEVFCEKEQNLRKMLDAFPGADIMEAQDILVRCQWDFSKALEVARQKPLRTTRKRSFSNAPQAAESTGQPSRRNSLNFQPSASPGQSKVTEEIVLDSSSDEDISENNLLAGSSAPKSDNRQNASMPAAKRAKRLISSDSEDDTQTLQQPQQPATPVQPNNVRKPQQSLATATPNANKQSSVTAAPNSNKQSPVTAAPSSNKQSPIVVTPNSNKQSSTTATPIANIAQSEKTVSVPKSVTIKAVPNSASSNSEQSKNSSPAQTMPNLPKGLVITQIQSANNSSTNKTATENKNSESSVNGNGKSSNVTVSEVNPIPETPNISSINKTNSKSNATKPLHLVRIKSSNSSLSITPSDKSKTNSASGNSSNSVSVSKSVSITPVSKSLSITPVGGSKSKVPKSASSINVHNTKGASKSKIAKGSKRKKIDSGDEDDEEYGNEDIYDSEDSETEENLTSAHSAVLKFFQESSADELGTIPGCSKKKVEAIMNIRPFNRWLDLVEKLKNEKSLSTDLLNGAKKVIDMRNAINRLMTKCQQISLDMEDLVENLKTNKESSSGYVSKQPDLLNDRMHLTCYQMLGLNWLLLLHNQEVNGILADEMGLGKTVQAIAFLAYLKETGISGPHLIVVPSSVLDNWKKELETWWPTVSIICYHGVQESRRELRMQIVNDEVDEFDVMITTYNMITSSAEDRSFFKRLDFHYVVFDEAHMLKNMSSQRYQNLMRIKAPRRLLLTGTPLQNNLVELMSLLIFAMPHMFSGKTEQIKQMFSCVSKTEENKNTYEKDRIDHAKRIMKPFVLRRLKKDVLQELPVKHEETKFCPMSEDQASKYKDLVETFTAEVERNEEKEESSSSGAGMMMQLRRAANHPLLLRRYYDDDKLLKMAKLMIKEPTHSQSDPNIVFEDMAVMSDFELHKLCKTYKSIRSFALPDEAILDSGKFKALDMLLPKMIEEDHRILLFSQFTMVLDIVEDYMNIKGYKFLRLDGQVPVTERQQLIDEFNSDPTIPLFLLSTRAGGLGINLTAADTVILHDIDFNPYNDKQAEDRCHRVGQVRDVRVIRLISEGTIEEGILQRAKEKLKLERDIHEENGKESMEIFVFLKKFLF